MKHTAARLAALGAVAAVAFAVSASAATAATLTGAGSTLVLPLVTGQFVPDFTAAGAPGAGDTVTDSGGGSSVGIQYITATKALVDFGTSDAPLSFTQAESCPTCVQIPWVLSATGPDYNLSGITSLKLTGKVLAAIYEGKIVNWDDARIQSLNNGETLPNEPISVIYRNDGSGDTYVFTNYLSDVDPQWKSQVGAGLTVNWPVGTGAKGNSGVAAAIKGTAGAIGYVSTFYTVNDMLTPASIENNAGKYILPYSAGQEDAADLVTTVKPNVEPLIVDPPYKKVTKPKGKLTKAQEKAYKAALKVESEEAGAYPISTFTDIIVRPDDSQLTLLQSFVNFCISTAEQAKVDSLASYANSYAPIPTIVRKEAAKEVAAL